MLVVAQYKKSFLFLVCKSVAFDVRLDSHVGEHSYRGRNNSFRPTIDMGAVSRDLQSTVIGANARPLSEPLSR